MHIDLHLHSSHSQDGEIAPAELVRLAKAAGMDRISVNDHNRASANPEAMAAGEKLGIEVVPGIEIDCLHEGLELHILGHFIDWRDRRYAELWEDVETQERESALKRIRLVRELGVSVDEKAVMEKSRDGVVTGELLAEVSLADPANADNPLLLPYRPGGKRSDNPFVNFYWDYCSPGKPAFVEIRFMSLPEATALITDTGGIPTLAHPGQSLRGNRDKLAGILAGGVRGIEAFSSYHAPEESDYWFERAREAGALVSCGSDFHGKTKPAIRIGGHGGEIHAKAISESFSFFRG